MAQDNPRPPGRKLGLIAPAIIALAIVLIVAGVLLTQGGDESAPAPETPAPPSAPAPAPVPATTPTPTPMTLDRQALIEAAGAAAAAYSNGVGVQAEKEALAGRSFAIRIPFGCTGPQKGGTDQAFYELDSQRRTVKLVARPTDWSELPVIGAQPAGRIEAVEGFWIPRPWTYADRCPSRPVPPATALPTPPATQTLGLASLFEVGGSRVERRGGRAYEHVVKLAPGEAPPASGYRLVLEGRLSAFADGRAIRCWSESPDHRPICLFAVELDRVAFEASDSDRVISEWPSSAAR